MVPAPPVGRSSALLLALALLAASTTVEAAVNCVLGPFDLTKIPPTTLTGNMESDPTVYNWAFKICPSPMEGLVSRQRGTTSPTSFSIKDSALGSHGFPVMTYSHASNGDSFEVTLKCGSSPLAFEKSNNQVSYSDSAKLYTTTVLSTHTCKPSSGCGGGCLFVVLFFVAVAVYVLGTVLWYYFKEGRRGADLIPHREFWLDFPILLKDGFMFLVNKIRALMGGASHVTYEEM